MVKAFTISTLNNNGRFGNMLHAYSFGMGIARKYNVPLLIPSDNILRKIFDITNGSSDDVMNTARTPLDYIPTDQDCEKFEIIDLFGYWQNQRSIDFFSEEDVSTWLPFKDKWFDKFCFSKLDDYIAYHHRKGDYVNQTTRYCTISIESYYKIVNKLLELYNMDVYNITEENPLIDEECENLDIGFLPDFMKLINASILIRGNSTFSWWASIFNNIYTGGKTFSPLVENRVGYQDVEFVEGNWPRLADPSNFDKGLCNNTDLYLRKV